jgi:hypothetical protein
VQLVDVFTGAYAGLIIHATASFINHPLLLSRGEARGSRSRGAPRTLQSLQALQSLTVARVCLARCVRLYVPRQ